MKIDRQRFLLLAMSMGAGSGAQGCVIYTQPAQPTTGTQAGSWAATNPNAQAQPSASPSVLPAPSNPPGYGVYAPARECMQWSPAGECVQWMQAQAVAPSQECTGWSPTGECIQWLQDPGGTPSQECMDWNPAGECIRWIPRISY